jgi:hypothetical protein
MDGELIGYNFNLVVHTAPNVQYQYSINAHRIRKGLPTMCIPMCTLTINQEGDYSLAHANQFRICQKPGYLLPSCEGRILVDEQ